MMELILALFTGFIVGVLFQLLKLPTPAPQVLAGIVGIFGIYLGAKTAPFIQKYVLLLFNHIN